MLNFEFLEFLSLSLQGLEQDICKYGLFIGELEETLNVYKEEKEKAEQNIRELQGSD